jgi:hypothetical protein
LFTYSSYSGIFKINLLRLKLFLNRFLNTIENFVISRGKLLKNILLKWMILTFIRNTINLHSMYFADNKHMWVFRDLRLLNFYWNSSINSNRFGSIYVPSKALPTCVLWISIEDWIVKIRIASAMVKIFFFIHSVTTINWWFN